MNLPETKKDTFGEQFFNELDHDLYLQEIFENLLFNYSVKLFALPTCEMRPFNSLDAARFADLLSKSAGLTNSERHVMLAQEMIILLREVYPNDPVINLYAPSVLKSAGNYPGLSAIKIAQQNPLTNEMPLLDSLYENYEKNYLAIPYQEDTCFLRSQKVVYDELDNEMFSYSGPTSMGKSLLIQTFIKSNIKAGAQMNFAILVPTKALISEVSANLIASLSDLLFEKNYRVVTSVGSVALESPGNFVFVLTPERLHYLLIGDTDIRINYLFIDEAHKISSADGRSAFYYKVISLLMEQDPKPHVIFASPNIPNPEIYMELAQPYPMEGQSYSTQYSPVNQLKYLVDLENHDIQIINDLTGKSVRIAPCEETTALSFIQRIIRKSNKQNIVYTNSKDSAIEMAREYAAKTEEKQNARLMKLAEVIRKEIHEEYFLSKLVRRGVAYHVGYLPTSIRTEIEECFRNGDIDIIFCTSTLMEGVNLPASNLFVTSCKNGNKKLSPVDFKNLIGRVGRIKYNLYGTVFLIRGSNSPSIEKIEKLVLENVPSQKVSIANSLKKSQKELIANALLSGSTEFKKANEQQTEEQYSLMRKTGLMLLQDIIKDRNTYVRRSFKEFLSCEQEEKIREIFRIKKAEPDEDINISTEQAVELRNAVKRKHEYPKLNNGYVMYDSVLELLEYFCEVFRWDIYEKKLVGNYNEKKKAYPKLSWYATILTQWMNGRGLKVIIHESIQYKDDHRSDVFWKGKMYEYDGSTLHKNIIIADILETIDNVFLFTLANYFLKFSTEYKKQHNVDSFDNDWYEYIEYGSTNKLTILLQKCDFTRDTSLYIRNNKDKYILETESGYKLHPSLLSCPNEKVQNEAKRVKLNLPEKFLD